MKRTSALLPIGMSLTALGIVLAHAATHGIVHEADEGTAAHLFQLLMVAQVPIIIFFAFKWLPRARREAMLVLAMHGVAILAACASVYFLT